MRVVNWLDFIRNYKGMCWLGARSVYDSNGLLIAANTGTRHTQPTLTDPGCDDYTKWTVDNSATLSNPSAGIMKVLSTGVGYPGGYQSPYILGCRYNTTAICRGDGVVAPLIKGYADYITGTISNDWQTVTLNSTPNINRMVLGVWTATTGYAEFNSISVTNLSLASAPPIIREGAWNNTNFIQATAANMPWDIDTGSVSAPGRHAMKFASGDLITLTPNWELSDWTVYVVVKPDSVTSLGYCLGMSSNVSGIALNSTSVFFYYNGSTLSYFGPTVTLGNKYILTVSKTGRSVLGRVNNGAFTQINVDELAISKLILGGRGDGTVGCSGEYYGVVALPKGIGGSRIDKLILHGLAHETGVTL